MDAEWNQNRSRMCPKSISECTSFSEAFLDRFLMAKWCKSDFADLCFDIAGVRRTAIFHKSSSTVFYQIWEPKMIQQIDLKATPKRLKNDLKNHKTILKSMRNRVPFCFDFGCQVGSISGRFFTMRAESAQEGPRSTQDVPKSSQDRPR